MAWCPVNLNFIKIIKICDTSIKHSVYNSAKFKQGIIVKPFPFHVQSNNKTANQTISTNSTE